MTDEQRKEHVAALLSERAQYERRGLTDRVAQVDEQLHAFGADAAAPAKRAAKRVVKAKEHRG